MAPTLTCRRWTAPCFLLTACAPLTFSEPAAIDFDAYRSARAAATSSIADFAYVPDFDTTAYFADQLREVSGFTSVTIDPVENVDIEVSVEVTVTAQTDENNDIEYKAQALYQAATPDGVVIDLGNEDDTGSEPREVVEDVLDEVALHYIKPFRL